MPDLQRAGELDGLALRAKLQRDRTKTVRIRKSGGDDIYSWALFINGREAYNGMSKSEASWRRKRYIETGEL